ncbi:MAG: glycosyltransferase family 2 protein [Spirochaetota bacterium]
MVDIVFVCYNNQKDIPRCFSSLEENTGEYEKVILIDNNSEEPTIEAIEKYKSIFKKGRFVFHRNTQNLGYAKALNQGIELSSSPYLVFANLDIKFQQNWLPPLIEQLQKKEVGFVGPKIYDSRGRLNSCGIGGSEKKRHHRGWGRKDKGQFDRVEEVISVSGALFGAKRRIFDEIGMFDENFFLYFEETEMHIRARRAGYKIIYTPHSRIVHYLGKSPKNRQKVKDWFKQSEEYFNRKLGFN